MIECITFGTLRRCGVERVVDYAAHDAHGAGADAAEAEADDRADRGDAAASAVRGGNLSRGHDVAALKAVPPLEEVGLEVEQPFVADELGRVGEVDAADLPRVGPGCLRRARARSGPRPRRLARVAAPRSSARLMLRSALGPIGAARAPRESARARRDDRGETRGGCGRLHGRSCSAGRCGRSSARASAVAVPPTRAARVGATRSHSAPVSMSAKTFRKRARPSVIDRFVSCTSSRAAR